MAIFPKIEVDPIVQVSDKVRINATKTDVSKDEAAISLVEIDPGDGSGYIDVTGNVPINSKNWFLDYEYATDGDYTILVQVTTDGPPSSTSYDVSVITAAEDRLFSSDQDLILEESEILRWVPDGRASFKYVHRSVQNLILEWLYRAGYTKYEQAKYTKADIIDISEVSLWSRYWVLALIYKDNSNKVAGALNDKQAQYESLRDQWSQKSILRLDYNGDGVSDPGENLNLTSLVVNRR